MKLSQSEVKSMKNLIDGYRQSASFLHRSADELEKLLKHCEAYSEEDKNKNTTTPEVINGPQEEDDGESELSVDGEWKGETE